VQFFFASQVLLKILSLFKDFMLYGKMGGASSVGGKFPGKALA
jgi:hypothetical protein